MMHDGWHEDACGCVLLCLGPSKKLPPIFLIHNLAVCTTWTPASGVRHFACPTPADLLVAECFAPFFSLSGLGIVMSGMKRRKTKTNASPPLQSLQDNSIALVPRRNRAALFSSNLRKANEKGSG